MGSGELIGLQERLHGAILDEDQSERSHLVIMVGGRLWSLPFESVAAVLTCGHITRLLSYQGLPSSVVGISSAGEEVLTVIDAALVLDAGRRTVMDLKCRLITFSDSHLRGVGLLVQRVLDPVSQSQLEAQRDAITPLNIDMLSKKINLGASL